MFVDCRVLSKWHACLLQPLLFGLNEWVVYSSSGIPIHRALWLWWAWCICLPPASMLPQFMVQELCSTEAATLYSSKFYSRLTQHGTGIRVTQRDSRLMAVGEAIEKRVSLGERKMHQVESLHKQKKDSLLPASCTGILLPSKWWNMRKVFQRSTCTLSILLNIAVPLVWNITHTPPPPSFSISLPDPVWPNSNNHSSLSLNATSFQKPPLTPALLLSGHILHGYCNCLRVSLPC